MQVYLLRHGHALSTQESGCSSDSERPLSEQGKAEIRSSLAELLRQGGRPRLILHSALRRARESAQIAHAVLPQPHEVRLYPPLNNVLAGYELEPLLLKDCAGIEQVIAIGHQPQLGDLAALLSKRDFELRTGGLIAIEAGGANAKALWSYNPG